MNPKLAPTASGQNCSTSPQPQSRKQGTASADSSQGQQEPRTFKHPRLMFGIRNVLNTLVLLGSLLIIAALSFETFYDTQGEYFHLYLKIQLWVCIIFMAESNYLYMLYSLLY